MINDLLDLSKIDAGHIKLVKEEFDISLLYKELYTALSTKILSNEVELKLSMPYDSLLVNYDRVRMSQVLTNFCTNAIKFTQKGIIEMGYLVQDNSIKSYVKDSGFGISEDNKGKVFQRF